MLGRALDMSYSPMAEARAAFDGFNEFGQLNPNTIIECLGTPRIYPLSRNAQGRHLVLTNCVVCHRPLRLFGQEAERHVPLYWRSDDDPVCRLCGWRRQATLMVAFNLWPPALD